MSPATCCIICGKDKSRLKEHVTLHRFPRDETLRKKWIAFGLTSGALTNRDVININVKICSRHFKARDYAATPIGKPIRLRKTAVPSIVDGKSASLLATGQPNWARVYMLPTNISLVKLEDTKNITSLNEANNETPSFSTQGLENQIQADPVEADTLQIHGEETTSSLLSEMNTVMQINNEQSDTSGRSEADVDLPANMVRDLFGKIWLTNKNGQVEKERDGVMLIVDPKAMTVTAKIISRF